MTAELKSRPWDAKKTDETRLLENVLRRQFPDTEAYRLNPASIRVRSIDDRFRGMSEVEREQLVDPVLEAVPEDTQADVMLLLTVTTDEIVAFGLQYLTNLEFENPSESAL
jgi:hypothetical protein